MSLGRKPDLVLMIVCAFFIAAITGYIGFTTNDMTSSLMAIGAFLLGLFFIKIGNSK